jgi:outer membrane lipase/esterase
MKRSSTTAFVFAFIVFILAAAPGVQAQTQFNKIVVFGDSLSDGGAYTSLFRSLNLPGANQVQRFKFTTNPGNVWVENVAERLGLPLTPNALDGGTNYAEGGARVTLPNPSSGGVAQTAVSLQVDRYLSAGGTFDKHSIVTLLVGANDIFQGGAAGIPAAAQALAQQVSRLQQAGASNIVLVALPDIGSTPAFGYNMGGAANPGTQGAVSFNTELKRQLQQAGGRSILLIDMFGLYTEVLANPGAYGIQTVRGLACMVPSSGQCTPATTVANGAETYLFADGVHPTTAGHRILSDAAIAQLLAPSQISLLPLSVQSSMRSQQLAYDDRLYPNGGHAARTLQWFASAGYAPYKIDSSGQLNGVDAINRAITFGGDYQPSETWGFGAAVSHSRGTTDFGNDSGGFDTKLTSVGVYGRKSYERVYTFISGSYGRFSLDDIRRSFSVNTATRVESGETSGSAASAKVGAGYDLPSERFRFGPVIDLNYERVNVDGFAENGTSSTQLTFGSQRLSQLTGSIGLQARAADNSARWLPYARVTYDYNLTHNDRTVSIAGPGSAVAFDGKAFVPARASFGLTAGITARIARNIAVNVNSAGILSQSHISGWGLTAGVKLF